MLSNVNWFAPEIVASIIGALGTLVSLFISIFICFHKIRVQKEVDANSKRLEALSKVAYDVFTDMDYVIRSYRTYNAKRREVDEAKGRTFWYELQQEVIPVIREISKALNNFEMLIEDTNLYDAAKKLEDAFVNALIELNKGNDYDYANYSDAKEKFSNLIKERISCILGSSTTCKKVCQQEDTNKSERLGSKLQKRAVDVGFEYVNLENSCKYVRTL